MALDRKKLLEQAFLKIEDLQEKLKRLENNPPADPIAVVGIGCRFPGDVYDPQSFWRFLMNETDAVGDIPSDRWRMEDIIDPEKKDVIYSRHGAFLKHVEEFDASFFGISPREAIKMDPQQRMLLEVVWEALEHGGQASPDLSGSSTGVYIGLNGDDYSLLMDRALGYDGIDLYFGTGVARSIAAGRIAYAFGLKGPCLCLDTACSGSLVAVHLACRSLRMRECNMAIAGGITLMLTPDGHLIASRGGMLSHEGRCKTFDAGADGYVRGEGIGIVVLKRLSDAIKANDNILAVIKGTAINQDGRSGGITAPSGKAQEEVIKSALTDAGITPEAVGYIETHGTGTILGDPIEVESLGNVFGKHHSKASPLFIGAVKTNVGHLEAAAGIVGLIKIILMMKYGKIPPSLHFHNPNPHVPWDRLPLKVVTQSVDWPFSKEKQYAGVSSFGFSGTNAHAIVQPAPPISERVSAAAPMVHGLALSAKNERALDVLAQRYFDHLGHIQQPSATDICYTANCKRPHHSQRMLVIGKDVEEIKKGLADFVKNKANSAAIKGSADGKHVPGIAFLFTGQGAQNVGMGRNLYETQPVYRKVLDTCNEILSEHLKVPLISILYPQPDKETDAAALLNQTAYTQPALFAMEYALFELWKSWGINPSVVMGHSVGEYTAACAAGIFSLEDGLKLIAERGRLMQTLPAGGAMAAVFSDEHRVAEFLELHARDVAIAAVNSDKNIVISGPEQSIRQILAELENEKIRSQQLTVSHAFHSHLMDPILQAFREVVSGVKLNSPKIDIISNITGKPASGAEMKTPDYWSRHIRLPVRFKDSIQSIESVGYRLFLEIGPHATLVAMASQTLISEDAVTLSSLQYRKNDGEQMLKALGELYVRGAAVNWNGIEAHHLRSTVILPTYPFQRERYWVQGSAERRIPKSTPSVPSVHPLLERRLNSPGLEKMVFETRLNFETLAYIKDHQIFDTVLVPATVFLEMAQAAASLACDPAPGNIESFNIYEPLIIGNDGDAVVQIIISGSSGQFDFEIHSLVNENFDKEPRWQLHAAGQISSGSRSEISSDRNVDEQADWDQLEEKCQTSFDSEWYYRKLEKSGVQYGPAFRCLDRICRGAGQAIARFNMPDMVLDDLGPYHVHPSILDACIQLMGIVIAEDENPDAPAVYLPMGLKSYQVRNRFEIPMFCHVRLDSDYDSNRETFSGNIRLLGEKGRLLAEIAGLRFKKADASALRKFIPSGVPDMLYETIWRELPILETKKSENPEAGIWLVFGDQDGFGSNIRDHLQEHGRTVRMVFSGDRYEENGSDKIVIDPDSADDYKRLMGNADANFETPICGLIYLWSMGIDPPAGEMDLAETHSLPLMHLCRSLAQRQASTPLKLTIVTNGAMAVEDMDFTVNPLQTAIWGMGRVIANEMPELACKLVDVSLSESAPASLVSEAIRREDAENQVVLREARRYGLRLVRSHGISSMNSTEPAEALEKPYQLDLPGTGVIDELKISPAICEKPLSGEVQLKVLATGLNFRDVLNALGMYPGEPGPLGNECIGYVTAIGDDVEGIQVGDTVMALTNRAFCSFVNTNASWTAPLPDGLSIHEAATIPMTFLTAYYALFPIGQLKRNERVLIHAGAGGVGMAALQLARNAGAEVFATAGSPEKREFLRASGVRHVMDSRTLDFAHEILEITNGEGVDIVLNSLAGEFISKSISVLRNGGRFLELGKTDLWDAEKVAAVNPDISYHVVFLGDASHREPELIRSMFHTIGQDLAEGALTPLPLKVFPMSKVRSAFRYMAQAKHIGKIVIDQNTRQTGGMGVSPVIRSNGTYLITGGTGGLGRSFAGWLAQKGAGRIILFARGDGHDALRSLKKEIGDADLNVTVVRGNIGKFEDIQKAMDAVDPAFPLRGIIHAAGTVDDALISDQSAEKFLNVFSSKVSGSWLLHQMTQHHPLDFMVFCSAGAALLGAAGQSNYAWANAFMDGLAQFRRLNHLPSVSINWGPWSGLGMTANISENQRNRWLQAGMGMIDPHEGNLALETAIGHSSPTLAVLPIRWPRLARQYEAGHLPALFAESVMAGEGKASQTDKSGALHPDETAVHFYSDLRAMPPEDRMEALMDHVRGHMASALGLVRPEDLSANQGLTELGMDSLMAVEISNRLKKSLNCKLPSTLAFEYPTLEAIAEYLAIEVLDMGETVVETDKMTPGDSQTPDAAETADAPLSEAEAEKALLKELEDTGY